MIESHNEPKTIVFSDLTAFFVIAASLMLVILVFPVAYQTNDDPAFAMVLQGDNVLGIEPDSHSIHIHFFLGWIVSFLSKSYPNIAWYGLLMSFLYILAYTLICFNILKIRYLSSSAHFVTSFLAFVGAFALLPLVLFQFTILAGVLALAGMLPCILLALRHEASSPAIWAVSALCVILGFMVRFQMAAVVLAICIPPLVFSLFFDRNRKQSGSCVAYAVMMGVLGLGLYCSNLNFYLSSPLYGSFFEFNRLNFVNNDGLRVTGRRGLAEGESGAAKWMCPGISKEQIGEYIYSGWAPLSTNDRSMIRGWMGIDNGPFRVKKIRYPKVERDDVDINKGHGDYRRIAGASDSPRRTQQSRRSIMMKAEGILRGSSPRHVLLAIFLVVVIGSGMILTTASAILGAWRIVCYLVLIACGVGACSLVTAIFQDRAVFRVLFPCANTFVTAAIILFPWDRLRSWPDLTAVRRGALYGSIGGFVFLGAVGIGSAGAQIRQNFVQKAQFRENLRVIKATIGTQYTVVAWPSALHIEYASPFERLDESLKGIYYIGLMISHPRLLNHLKRRFGDDVYTGLSRSDVAHLAKPQSLGIMKNFYGEHYGRQLVGVDLGSFGSGSTEVAGWVFIDERAQEPDLRISN